MSSSFSETEIQIAKELKRLGIALEPKRGRYLSSRHCPEGCIEIAPQVFMIIDPLETQKDAIWLPTFDELLELAKKSDMSFSFITDFIHRRRFADRNEREGLMQAFIEKLR